MTRALIVEDESDLRRVLCESVAQMGLETAEAADGVEALAAWRNGRFDVVITDLAMPRMDGLELTGRIKSLDPSVPVLMITGQHSLDLMARAVNRGIADYLRKPFRPTALEDSILRTLQRRGIDVLPAEAPQPAAAPRRHALGWLLLAVAFLLSLLWGWWLWQGESGLRELVGRVDGVRTSAP